MIARPFSSVVNLTPAGIAGISPLLAIGLSLFSMLINRETLSDLLPLLLCRRGLGGGGSFLRRAHHFSGNFQTRSSRNLTKSNLRCFNCQLTAGRRSRHLLSCSEAGTGCGTPR